VMSLTCAPAVVVVSVAYVVAEPSYALVVEA
jgi:hypothetical protein